MSTTLEKWKIMTSFAWQGKVTLLHSGDSLQLDFEGPTPRSIRIETPQKETLLYVRVRSHGRRAGFEFNRNSGIDDNASNDFRGRLSITEGGPGDEVLFGVLGCRDPQNGSSSEEDDDTEIFIATREPVTDPKG